MLWIDGVIYYYFIIYTNSVTLYLFALSITEVTRYIPDKQYWIIIGSEQTEQIIVYTIVITDTIESENATITAFYYKIYQIICKYLSAVTKFVIRKWKTYTTISLKWLLLRSWRCLKNCGHTSSANPYKRG